MRKLSYWIKERHNPQLGIYYVLCGQMTVAEAKKYESSLYGSNIMWRYKTEEEYKRGIQRLKDAGESVQ